MKAKTLNRHLNAGRARALAEHEEPLAAALERIFVKAGDAAARRFEASAVDHLTAAAPAPTATMVAVYPSPEEAVALAQPNGEPAEILHVTLAYLGEIDPDQAEAAVAVVQQVATEYGSLEGIVGGIAAFGASESSDGLSPSILLPDVPGLAELRQGVCDALDAAGIDYATNHGWQPHLTLVYTEEPQPPPVYTLGLPLTFDRLTVARGDVPRDFPLGALTAAGGPADWTSPHPDEVIDVAALVSQIRAKNDEVRRAAVAAAMTPALEKAGLDFDVTNPLVGAVLARSGQHVSHVAETTRLNVMRTIRESYEQGLSIPDTAGAIRVGMAAAAPARARLIARTELARVVNGGAVATARIVGEAAGVTYEKSWLCLSPETVVRATDVTHLARRLYDGPLIQLSMRPRTPEETPLPEPIVDRSSRNSEDGCDLLRALAGLVEANGLLDVEEGLRPSEDSPSLAGACAPEESLRDLAVTPEHPILTTRGWIPAELVKEGDYLVRYRLSESDRDRPDVDDVPASIAEVFGTAAEGRSGIGVVGAPVHLNVSSGDGQVEVVPTDGELMDGFDPASAEPFRKLALAFSDVKLAELLANGGFRKRFLGLSPSCLNDPPLLEHALAGAGVVGTATVGGALVADGHPLLGKDLLDEPVGDAELPPEPLHGYPALVELDEVVGIERRPFAGARL